MKRFYQIFFAILLAVTGAASGYALPSLRVASQFIAADGSRTSMDIGGVWNGSANVATGVGATGDTFVVTFTNEGDDSAFGLSATATLPAGFHYVPGTATVQGVPVPLPAISAQQSGNLLTFTLTPEDIELPAGASFSIRYGLRADDSVSSGTMQIVYDYAFAALPAEPPVAQSPHQQNVLVIGGDSVLQVTGLHDKRAVHEVQEFTVTVRNTSRGGLFDVQINESQINAANHLQLLAPMTQTSPALPATATGNALMTLPYLAPGEEFTLLVRARVLSCGNIVNIVTTTDATGRTAASNELPVKLDLQQPLITFVAPQITLGYRDPVQVSIPFTNTRLGAAENFVLHTNLPSLPVTISNVDADWEYDAAAGTFRLLGNDGIIDNAAARTLTFEIQATDACTSSGAGIAFFETTYTNSCGDEYFIPQRIGQVLAAEDTPSLTLSKAVSANRIAVRQAGSYTLSLSAAHPENISDEEIVVTDNLPDEINLLSQSATVGAVTVLDGVLTWRLPRTALAQAQELTINFAVREDPCLAGNLVANNASVSVQTVRGCVIEEASQAQFFVSNNPELVANQFFNTGALPAGKTFFETGSETADLTQDRGEGDFIPFEAYYEFSTGYPGIWAGSTYTDDFGSIADLKLVPGSLTYTFDNGTTTQGPLPVPAAYVTQQATGFRIDLSFLSASVEGTSLRLNYRVTAPDSALAGAATRQILQRTHLVLAEGGTGNGICNDSAQDRFTQGVFYSIGRAAATISFSGMPAELELCKVETVRINVGNVYSGAQLFNPQVTLLNNGTPYEVLTGSAPVFGGGFAGNMTYDYNGGSNPVFTYTGGELTQSGWIEVQVRRNTASTAPTGFSARVNYDSHETEEAANIVYDVATSYAPLVVHQANIALTVTPGTLNVVGTTVEYTIYLTNTNAGTAFNTILRNTLPQGITILASETDAKNASAGLNVPVIADQQNLVWELGDIGSGQMVAVTVVAEVVGDNCSIALAGERITASWGCSGATVTLPGIMPPVFFFPQGKMQVVHDSASGSSMVSLCEGGTVAIIVRNTGPTDVLDVVVNEMIPANSGIELIDSAESPIRYRVNGQWKTAIGRAVRNGDVYTLSSAQIPELALLSPQGAGGTQEVRIEFDILADSTLASLTASPVLNATASAKIACGNSVVSPAQSFSLPMERPRIILSREGRNVTANPAADFSEVVYGGQGDVIEWRVTLRNTGESTAKFLRIRDQLSQSNPSSVVVNGPGIALDTVYTPGQWLPVNDLMPGQSAVYVFTEVLGNNCVNGSRTADAIWGCSDSGAGVNSPGTPSDSATIIMAPVIGGQAEIRQEVTYLNNGRAQIHVVISNSGGNALNLEFTGTLSSGMVYDDSVAPQLTHSGNASISGVTLSAAESTALAPVFRFTGPQSQTLLRYGEEIRLNYYVRPSVTDTLFAETFPDLGAVESTLNGLDPSAPANVTNTIEVRYDNSCGGDYAVLDPFTFQLRLPDIDITAVGPNAGNNLLSETSQLDYTFEITNAGSDSSVAEHITLDFPGLGAGWQVVSIQLTTPGQGGTGGTAVLAGGLHTFTPTQVGTLRKGDTALVTATLRYDANASNGPLRLLMRARGAIMGQDGSTNYGNYSYDQRAQRALGVSIAKTLVSTSEDNQTDNIALIGEEARWRITAKFRGGDGSVENLVIREQLLRSLSTDADTNNLAYVGHAYTANHDLDMPTPLDRNGAVSGAAALSDRIDFQLASITPAAMATGKTFETIITSRVMNDAANVDGASLTSYSGMAFEYMGMRFYSPIDPLEFSFGNAVPGANLHASGVIQVRRPQLGLVRQARNITQNPGGPFLAEASGQAGDVIEYRVTVSNPASGQRPLFSIVVEDTVHGKMELLPYGGGGTPGADTDGNNSADIFNTTGLNAAAGTVRFDESNTVIPVDSVARSLAHLDAGQSVVLVYQVRMLQAVNPSEELSSTVTATGHSLPHPHGSQSARHGVPGAEDGSLILTRTVSTPVITIDGISHGKSVVGFSASPLEDLLVTVGEQIRYQIRIEIPQGTVSDFVVVDELPAGLALLETPVVLIGSGISRAGEQPLISPTVLPASGASGRLEVKWEFGERIAQIGSSVAERTVTIEYLTQVRNIAANRIGEVLTNEAHYTFTGLPEDVVNLERHSVTIAEPQIVLTKTVSPNGEVQAGDVLTYTVKIDNAGGTAAAYDFSLIDTLPLGVTYVAGSTTTLAEPELSGDADDGWVLTWGRNHTTPQDHDIAAGASLEFTYQVKVDDTSHPEQVYANSIRADWSSLNGTPGPNLGIAIGVPGVELGERIGDSQTHNTYHSTAVSTLNARNSTAVVKTAAGQTLPINADGSPADTLSAFAIGDVVTYTLKLQVQEATLREFNVLDSLPAGLVFMETVSVTPASGTDGFTYSTPVAGTSAPDADATGELVWNFGTMINTGDGDADNDEITIVYTARIVNSAANPVPGTADLKRENSARIRFLTADDTLHTTAPSKVEITVSQPVILLEKTLIDPTPENILRPEESGKFRIRVRNTGTAPAYNLVLEDIIPFGMRETDPILTRADLNGTSILAQLQGASLPTWDAATGQLALELDDSQFINAGAELVLEYTFAIDTDAIKGDTLVNEAIVHKWFGRPLADTTGHRREYATALTDNAPVIVGLEIRGFVYDDIEPNGQRDAFENWSKGTAVYVNLVNTATNTVYRSTQVPAGEGSYVLTRLPRGNYRVIVTNTPTNIGAVAPTSWMFRMPQNGVRSLTLTQVDFLEQNFGLYQGLSINGIVFRDNGGNGGTPHDGERNGGEIGLPGATVRLINDDTMEQVGVAQTDGSGQFSLYVPDGITAGTTLVVEQVNLPRHRSVSGHAGNSGGSYDRTTDRISFVYGGGSVNGLAFGDVPHSSLTSDGMQRIEPGAAAYYRHTFIAGTSGTVVFETQSESSPSMAWSQAIIRDINCDGNADGEPTINGLAIAVSAGQEICLLVRDQSPMGVPYGAQNRVHVRAVLRGAANEDPALNETLVNIDLTTIGTSGAAGLTLSKTVDKSTAKPGEELSYTITYANVGTEPISDLFIDDRTPYYTTFVSAEYGTPPANLGAAVTVVAPVAGEAGSIRWTFDGTLAPGASGEVTFKVRVAP